MMHGKANFASIHIVSGESHLVKFDQYISYVIDNSKEEIKLVNLIYKLLLQEWFLFIFFLFVWFNYSVGIYIK